MTESMPDELFERYREFIHERSLIWFPASRAYLLESKVSRRARSAGIDGYRAYLDLIRRPEGRDEFEALIAEITTNETSFHRNPPQMEMLRKRLIPRLAREGDGPVRIWSAGCSSGEEPYSLALLVRTTPSLRETRVRIFANDISTRMIARAREATYDAYTLRNLSDGVVERHFERTEDGRYLLDRSVRSLVEFGVLNLADEAGMRRVETMDLILCRNTLIYFSDEGKQRTIGHFRESLREGGYLVLGHAETLWGQAEGFEYHAYPKAFAYRKQDETDDRSSRSLVAPPAPRDDAPGAP